MVIFIENDSKLLYLTKSDIYEQTRVILSHLQWKSPSKICQQRRSSASEVLASNRNVFKGCYLSCNWHILSSRAIIPENLRSILFFNNVKFLFFQHAFWNTQNPWFWALFEPTKISPTQLQSPVETFLWVLETYDGHSKVTSSNKLSNALALVSIGSLQRPLTFLVQKVFWGHKKKASFKTEFCGSRAEFMGQRIYC